MTGSNDVTEAGRTLAARRRRKMFVCEMCGRTYEATVRRDQPNRACSNKCGSKLRYRQRKQQQAATAPAI